MPQFEVIPSSKNVAVVFRGPGRLVLFDRYSGKVVASDSACGDSDDVYFDGPRKRLYAVCGIGEIDTFEVDGRTLKRRAATASASGARTELFVGPLDKLFVAARASAGKRDAPILVFGPR